MDLILSCIRFRPDDKELIVDFLEKKVAGEEVSPGPIHELDVYSTEPWNLQVDFKHGEMDNEAYFFTPRHPLSTRGGGGGGRGRGGKGGRVNRNAGSGFWHGKGHDGKIMLESRLIGHKTALNFRMKDGSSKCPDGNEWIMHEYRLHDGGGGGGGGGFQSIGLCRIYKKPICALARAQDEEQVQPQPSPRPCKRARADPPCSPPPPCVLAAEPPLPSLPLPTIAAPAQAAATSSLAGGTEMEDPEPEEQQQQHLFSDSISAEVGDCHWRSGDLSAVTQPEHVDEAETIDSANWWKWDTGICYSFDTESLEFIDDDEEPIILVPPPPPAASQVLPMQESLPTAAAPMGVGVGEGEEALPQPSSTPAMLPVPVPVPVPADDQEEVMEFPEVPESIFSDPTFFADETVSGVLDFISSFPSLPPPPPPPLLPTLSVV